MQIYNPDAKAINTSWSKQPAQDLKLTFDQS